MSTSVFSPGSSDATVRAANGAEVKVPAGWVLLPPGDAALTRRVKEAGDHWVVQERRGRKIFSRGVWAPAATIERIRGDLAAERSTDAYATRQVSAANDGIASRRNTWATSARPCSRSSPSMDVTPVSRGPSPTR